MTVSEGPVGIGRRGLEFRAAHHDAGIGLLDTLCPPVRLVMEQRIADGVDRACLLDRRDILVRILMLHVVDACPDIDQRLDARMDGDVLRPLAVDMDLASVPDGVAILPAGSTPCPHDLHAVMRRDDAVTCKEDAGPAIRARDAG